MPRIKITLENAPHSTLDEAIIDVDLTDDDHVSEEIHEAIADWTLVVGDILRIEHAE